MKTASSPREVRAYDTTSPVALLSIRPSLWHILQPPRQHSRREAGIVSENLAEATESKTRDYGLGDAGVLPKNFFVPVLVKYNGMTIPANILMTPPTPPIVPP